MDRWDRRFLDMAKLVASWSSCCKHNVGCVIVKNNRVITTGYNGAPSGIDTCVSKHVCNKSLFNVDKGPSMCYAAHAEQNAIVQAAKLGTSIDGATMYCTCEPCSICAKLIINSGIKRVVFIEEYGEQFARDIFKQSSVILEKAD